MALNLNLCLRLKEAVIEWMVDNSHVLRKSTVRMMLTEVAEAVLHFHSQGIPVRLESLGTFTPSIDRNGTIRQGYRADVQLKKRSNEEGAYTGRIINEERIGLDNAGYKELWDADHPNDPLEI